ncbi:hypothetical protein [Dyadobacter chenhuakuii]|uniref:Uncharacterized protein n=1 Tax=Dyadobacter chenhuakuii TaxID=2909339 RepID=A0A9X1QF31_9BACT|nr:hypothetical protein [Dyadobacter chenhuakuii]MCF2499173.1 hypothetical protein [Dyadobacter chenhuakuii]
MDRASGPFFVLKEPEARPISYLWVETHSKKSTGPMALFLCPTRARGSNHILTAGFNPQQKTRQSNAPSSAQTRARGSNHILTAGLNPHQETRRADGPFLCTTRARGSNHILTAG